MAVSKRLQILRALKTKLENIKTVNSYNNNIKRVTYSFISYTKVREFPQITMIPLVHQYVPLTNMEYTAGGSRNTIDGWRIAIIGYVKASRGEGNLQDAMEELLQDIKTAILADHTLGLSPFVHNAYLRTDDTEMDEEQTVGTVTAIFEVKYDFDKSVP